MLTNVVLPGLCIKNHSTVVSASVSGPFDGNSSIGIDSLDIDLLGNSEHLPFPTNFLSSLESIAVFTEPEFCGDVRVDKGLEYFRNGPTN